MARQKPRLRHAFDRAERTIGEPLEELVASRSFTETLVRLDGLRRAVNGAILGAASGAVEKALHAAQIPTRGDVRRLNRQIVELATEVRTLSEKLQEESLSQAPAAGVKRRGKTAAGTATSTPKRQSGQSTAGARRKSRSKRSGSSR